MAQADASTVKVTYGEILMDVLADEPAQPEALAVLAFAC